MRFKSLHQGCMGSSRSSEEAVRNFGWIWGWSAVKSCLMLYLLHAYNISFYFWQQSKMSFQPMPQRLPSLKQNNRWLDLEVLYLTYLAVVFCFLMMLGYELEIIPAALAASVFTEIKTAWFSHYYLPRLLLHVHLLCSEDPRLCM